MSSTDQLNHTPHVSQWYGITHSKCPRCRVGKVFTGATYGFKVQKMNERCPHCDLKFEREPGYFYVAMFVSYAMNVAQMISMSVAAYVLGLPLTYEKSMVLCRHPSGRCILILPFQLPLFQNGVVILVISGITLRSLKSK
jgi:uncharacterized protein (DUF983 family)